MFIYNKFKHILLWLLLTTLLPAVHASALFDGTTADAWLVETQTGRVVGYDIGRWLEQFETSDFPGIVLDANNAVLVNHIRNSSVPMTSDQPAVSLAGIGDSAITVIAAGQGGYTDLVLAPDTGIYDETIAVTIDVSTALLAQGAHTLNWTVGAQPQQSVELDIQDIGAAQNGYYTQTFFLVADGSYPVTVELRTAGGALIATAGATYDIAAGGPKLRRDTDGDSLPDIVELDIGLNPLEDDWNVDLDGDGWSELDEWLRRFCLDPNTRQPMAGNVCLDADGLPVDTDKDNWSDFDEILRGTNPDDPQPYASTSGGSDPDFTSNPGVGVNAAGFCVDDERFYFDIQLTTSKTDPDPIVDIAFSIAADGSVFVRPVEVISVNFQPVTGEITRQDPIAVSYPDFSTGEPPVFDRFTDGPITDFNLELVGPSRWRMTGSALHGPDRFITGDQVETVAFREFGPTTNYFGGAYDIEACADNATSGASQDFLASQRFKDFPSVSRLYEVEYQIDSGTLNVPPPAVLNPDQQSLGAKQADYSSIVMQSFTAVEDNIAGVDVVVAADAAGGSDDIILNIWGGTPRGELLHSQTLANVKIDTESDTSIPFRFEALALQPGNVYYLEFRKDTAKLASTGQDSYVTGEVLEADGVIVADQADLIFTTYTDNAFANGVGGSRDGMLWRNVVAASVNGKNLYDANKLLTLDEIKLAGLTPGEIVPRLRLDTVATALENNTLPAMRLPASGSVVVNAEHQYDAAVDSRFEPPLGYSRMYKQWLPRVADVSPQTMFEETGEGSWNTAEEWRNAFVAYLLTRLTLVNSPQLDVDTSLAINAIEAVLGEESVLQGLSKQQLFASMAQQGSSQFVKSWEQSLRRFDVDYTLDQSIIDLAAALTSGQVLAAQGDWLRSTFYAAIPGTRSDQYISRQLHSSIDESCFVRDDLLAGLQDDTVLWNEFFDACPDYFNETERDQHLADDQLRRYQLRLSLLPGAAAELAADVSLLTPVTDTDSDSIENQPEIEQPVEHLTLPWLEDSDGDQVPDGLDPCGNDPLNECSSNPVLPVVIADADILVAEPSSGSDFAIVGIRIDRIYDEVVTVDYEVIVDTGNTATAGVDFTSVSGSVDIAPGQLTALIEIPILFDTDDEGKETFSLRITSVDNASIGDDGIVLITLNDRAPDIVLAQTNFIVDERDPVQFDASLSSDASGETLNYRWQQVDSGGVPVSLTDMTTSQPSFVAPIALNPLALEFEVSVTNQSLLTSTARITVLVNPVSESPVVTDVPSYQVFSGSTLELTDEALLAFVTDPDNDPLSITSIINPPGFGTLTDTGNGFSYNPDDGVSSLAADQVSPGNISGGYGSPVVQTFKPQQTNIAGIDAYLHGTGALTSDVTLRIWINGALRIGDPVASVTLLDVPRSTMMEFRFSPVFVVPGVEYALEFIITDALTMGAIIPGQYPGGAVTEGGGNLFNGGADILFTTYFDPAFNGLPGNINVAQLSDPEIIDWAVLGTGDHVILHEIGAAQDLPGTNRIVDFDLENNSRTLVTENVSVNFITQDGSPAIYFFTDTELYRYEPGATTTLISLPLSDIPFPTFYDEVAVDPRNGDMHFCGRDPATLQWEWYRINHVDMSVNVYGSCGVSEGLSTVKIGSRMCAVKSGGGIVCTAQGGNELDTIYGYEPPDITATYRTLGIRQIADEALIFIVREEFSAPVDMHVRLLSDRLDLDVNNAFPPPPTFVEVIPLLLTQTGKEIAALPEVEALPAGGAAIVFAEPVHFDTSGELLEMWTWSGDIANLALTQLNIGLVPTVADIISSHMGKLKVIDDRLFWQVQEVTLDAERIIFEIDTTPGLPNALTEFARVPGSLSSNAPYDFVVAGPNTFGYLTPQSEFSDVCKVMSLDQDGSSAIAQEYVDCDNHRSVDSFGLLHEFVEQLPANLFLFGVTQPATGNTSFSVEVSDPDGQTVELPVQIQVMEPL